MTKFYKHIVSHRKVIIAVFLSLFAVCAVCQRFVAVNYDMNDYLPSKSASTQALDLMDKEYDGGIPNARVMVQNVSVPQALEYKEKLLAVDGVTDVTWLDDAASVTVPLETIDTDTAETYYKDGSALFSVTVAEDKRIEAVEKIREIIGDDNAMTGSAVTTAVATTGTVSEIAAIAVIAVAFVLFGALLNAVQNRPRFRACLGKWRGNKPYYRFCFMPALILSTYKLIDKTQHRSFMPSFKGFGKFVSCVMIPFVIIFAILIVPCYLASSANSFYYGASPIFGSATQLEADTEKIENAFGKRDTYVLMVPKNSTATQAEKYYPGEWYLAGEGVSTYDLMDTVTADMAKVNLVAIGAVFVVLLFTMKSFVLPVILVFSIETAIWINLSIPYFSNQAIFYIAYLIISSIQLGATVDYAILFTDRYREMRQTYAKRDAIIQTVSAVAVSILTSASVLTAVGFLLGAFSTHGLLSQLGYFLGKGTLCSLAIVLFVLPGLLYLCNKNIVKKSKEAVSQ